MNVQNNDNDTDDSDTYYTMISNDNSLMTKLKNSHL